MKNSSKKHMFLWANESILQPISVRMLEYSVHQNAFSHQQHFVGGYPRSGTTWICRMVAHYLALPWFDMTDLVPGFKGVMHHHWRYHPSLANSIYVVRDGRDVMVSNYAHRMKAYVARKKDLGELGNQSAMKQLANIGGRYAKLNNRFQHLYGANFDPWDVEANLPRFIDAEMQKPFNREAKMPWHVHIRGWLDGGQNITVVRYEDMLEDPLSTLTTVLRQYTNDDPMERDVSYTAERFSFKRMTGRNPGEESRTSFARKGIRGDWRNYFNSESRSLFDEYAGDLLIELGYERDHQWVQQ